MTEYEQRVAEALDFAHGGRLSYGDSVADIQVCDLCRRLAPRIVAAIYGAAAYGDAARSEVESIALAALRGTS